MIRFVKSPYAKTSAHSRYSYLRTLKYITDRTTDLESFGQEWVYGVDHTGNLGNWSIVIRNPYKGCLYGVRTIHPHIRSINTCTVRSTP